MSAPPLAVVHLDTGRGWRGGQQQVLLLHRELLALGVDSRVLAPAASPLLAACRERGLPAAALAGRRPWAGLVAPLAGRGGSVLHAHDSHAVGIAAAARWAGGGAVVAHRRVSFPPGRLGWRPKYRAVDRWIAVSGEIAEQLVAAGARADAVRVVPSAVDFERLAAADGRAVALGVAADAPVVVVVGALVAQKGQAVLVAAAPAILAAVPATAFVLVGDGPDRAALAAAAAAAGVSGAIRFVGFRDDVAALLARATLVVAPSRDGEGSPAAVKEAMAAGRAVVASDLAAHRDILGDAALLTPVGDAAALAAAVIRLLADPVARDRLAAAARGRLERFRPERMAAATLAVYRELVEETA